MGLDEAVLLCPDAPPKKQQSFEPTAQSFEPIAWPCYEEITRKINKSHLYMTKKNTSAAKYSLKIFEKNLISWRFKGNRTLWDLWGALSPPPQKNRHCCPLQHWSKWCQTQWDPRKPDLLISTALSGFLLPEVQVNPNIGKLHVNSQYINASKIFNCSRL